MGLRHLISRRDQQSLTSGAVNAGGLVWLFEPGTTTFVASFRESGLVTNNETPVRLSGSGRADAWITRDCDMFITDRNGVLPGGETKPTNVVTQVLSANPDALGAAESSGLVANGSFEIDGDADTVPDGWGLVSDAGSLNAIDASESTDGAQSFRFTSAGTGGGSLTTTNFFPVNDSDNLRVNVDLRSTVATVRNIIRVEWYDVSQVAISNSDPYDSTANPLTFTSQQLSVAPPAGARFAKLRLIGCDPSAAVAGSTYFDRVQVFYPAVVVGQFDNITIQNNEIITTNTNGDLNITPNGTGRVLIDNLALDGNGITATNSDGNVNLVPDGTGRVQIDGVNSNAFTDAEDTLLASLSTVAPGAEVNPDVISQAEAEAGTATAERIFTAQRIAQAIAALLPNTVSQAEAEAGTTTTTRLWTAQRVAQSISALASGGGLGRVRTGALARSSTATLADDDVLIGISLQPSTVYKVDLDIVWDFNGSATNGAAWVLDFNGQNANVNDRGGTLIAMENSGTAVIDNDASPAALGFRAGRAFARNTNFIVLTSNSVTVGIMAMKATVYIETTASYVADTAVDFQWAQHTSNGTSTEVFTGSSMTVTEIDAS